MDEATGIRLGQFELHEIIHRGGLSTIYKASQPSLGRFVAVKALHPVTDPQLVARFQLEARAIARLAHPNILPIYDYGEQDGSCYLVTQYIDGGTTLAGSLGQPMDPPTAVTLAEHVLDALHHAHQQGVVHRDVKPTNILMPSPTWPLLADFGIAKLVARAEDPQLTQQGFVVGTAAYMAPEQALGLPIDARTDVYAFGVVLYEMLTGQVPFDADTPTAALARHAYEPPPPPRSVAPDLPPSLEAVLLRALAKEPSDRYQTAAGMREALEHLDDLRGEPSPELQLTGLYASAVEAFGAECWNTAIERLERVLALDPDYEDAPELLTAAYRARATAPVFVPASLPERDPVAEPEPAEEPPPAPVARSPGPSRPGRRSWLLVGGAALLLLAAVVFAFVEHRPRARPPAIPPAVTVPIPGRPDFGRVRFSDGAGPLDTAVLTAEGLPLPSEGMQYEAWLLATPTGERRSMGVIQVDAEGRATADLTADGSNLLASFDALEVTVEPDPDTSPSPSGDVALRWALPPQALIPIRHLLVSSDDTPGRISLVSGLEQAIGAARHEASRMLDAQQAGDLEGMRRHAEALVNLIDGPGGPGYGDRDGDGTITGAGDGFGLGNGRRAGYLRAVRQQARAAAIAPDATPNITLHANHVMASTDNLARWTTQLRNLSLAIAAAGSTTQVRSTVDQAAALAAQLVTGPGSAETVSQHAQYLADLLITR